MAEEWVFSPRCPLLRCGYHGIIAIGSIYLEEFTNFADFITVIFWVIPLKQSVHKIWTSYPRQVWWWKTGPNMRR